ncbi:hypothetical protein Trydic_g20842 [Trypoxylus dichotomus]
MADFGFGDCPGHGTQAIGKNYGRSFSQDTQNNKTDVPKQRHVSATVQPNLYAAHNKLRESPSFNSISSTAKPRVNR